MFGFSPTVELSMEQGKPFRASDSQCLKPMAQGCDQLPNTTMGTYS